MEEIVLQLLHDDVAVRGRGFVKLTEAYKKPDSMLDLFKILNSSSKPEVRQYVAVLLKKRLVNAKHWFRLPQAARTDYKVTILKQLINEEISLRSNVLDLTIVIANHELSNSSSTSWPELFECIEKLLNRESSFDKEAGISLLSIVAANRPETLIKHVELIVCFLSKTLHSLQELNNTVIYNILLTILHLAPIVRDDENIKNAFHETMPQVICSIQALTEFDKDQATEVLELLDGLCKNVTEVISLHTAIVVTTCICVAENKLLDSSLRVKGLRIIKWLVGIKSKTIRNNELVVPIIEMIYSIMSEPVHNELGDFYLNAFTNNETPMTCAMQILDILSQYLPPQEFIPKVLQHTELIFEESDIYVKRGCYVVMAVVVEHCSKVIENECLDTFFKYVRQSLTDSRNVIRNVVQFTLARFVKYLQMKTSEHPAELLPILWEYLDSSWVEIEQAKDVPTIETLFYMLDIFCEFFEHQMVSYLPKLMDYLFGILESNASNHVKKLALKSFCTVTDDMYENISLYLPRLITILSSWVSEKQTEETVDLKAQIFANLSHIVRRIDEKEIALVATNFLQIGVKIVKDNSNPILKRAVYNYIAEMSYTTPTLVAEAVSQVFENMIRSVQMAERSKMNRFEDVQNEDILLYQESENDTLDIEDIDDDVIQFEIESSDIEEKKGAITALGVLAISLGESFYPYLERSYREVFKTINYPQITVRQASLHTLSQFFEAFSKVQSFESKEMMHNLVDVMIPIILGIIYKTNESSLIETAVITYSRILKIMKSKIPIGEEHKDATIKCIIDIFAGNTRCQNLKETYTERDNYVKYYVGDMFVNFQGVISSEESFDVFEQVLPLLLCYVEKDSMTEGRSFVIQMISQYIRSLGHAISKFAPQLVPLFIESVADPDTDLRRKSLIAISRITRYGGDALYPYYPDILKELLSALPTETDDVTRDNLIGTVGTLIWTNYSVFSIERVFPVFVDYLPLKTDLKKYKAVFGGILSLIRDHHSVLRDHIPALMKIAVNILQTDLSVNHEDIKEFATEFLEIVRQDYANIWDDIGTFLSSEEIIFVQELNLTEPSDMGILV